MSLWSVSFPLAGKLRTMASLRATDAHPSRFTSFSILALLPVVDTFNVI